MSPGDYPPADHIHEIAAAKFNAALRHGIPRSYTTLIPAGIFPSRFAVSASRQELRAQYGIRENTFVVLCVAALNRDHKRIDHLVEEFAQLEGDCLLWLDGSMDHGDADLPDWIMRRLGDRCRITRVRSADVGQLYHLADVMVLASVQEAFALVVPEALSCGLPVLAHDCEHFRWLIGSEANVLNMREPGLLSARLRQLRDHPAERERLKHTQEITARFDWANLKRDYLQLYHNVQTGPIHLKLGATPTPWRQLKPT